VLILARNGGIEMNKNKLKQFVNALDMLSDDVKDWDVEMESTKEPTCGTPGCHAGLISAQML
jgi:hypothetical protein